MLARRGANTPVIYDGAVVRHVMSVLFGAIAFGAVVGGAAAVAQEVPTTTTTVKPTTTTLAPVTTSTTARPATTTTTTKPPAGGATTTSTTTAGNGGRPVPPPASGPTQTLVPDLLGGAVVVDTSTTLQPIGGPFNTTRTTFEPDEPTAARIIASHSDSPNATTLILASVAWLVSFGGLLVYAEDQRSHRWRHLAR
jgi:hypothetical protein